MSKKPRKLPPWTRLERATLLPNSQIPDALRDAAYRNLHAVWKNSRYTVIEFREGITVMRQQATLIHLSIKMNDRSPHHDWRDFQRIKNELIGPEEEAVEIYPAEDSLVDTSNQYHLWCIPGVRLPFGFKSRLVSESCNMGAVQLPWEDAESRPKDLQHLDANACLAILKTSKAGEI